MSLTGWVVYNGNLESNAFLDFANMIEEAGKRKSIPIRKFKNNDLLAYLSDKRLDVISNKRDLNLPDFIVFTDKDIYLARQLEFLGVRLFNSSNSIETSDDKMKSYQLLANNKLPIPKTIFSPKIYVHHKNIDYQFINRIIDELSLPLIIKESFGSFGEQVYLVNSKEELLRIVHKLADRPLLFQEFISSSYGKDLRLQVVGDKVVAAMLRSSSKDFRANITAGGSMVPYEPTEEEKELAIAAAKAVEADYAGVDLLFGPAGKPIVCEINANAHIRNLYNCTGINAADYIISHIKNTLK